MADSLDAPGPGGLVAAQHPETTTDKASHSNGNRNEAGTSTPITNGDHSNGTSSTKQVPTPALTNGKHNNASNPALSIFSPNPALFCHPNHTVNISESPPLDPSEEDCIIHPLANGICGSDLHLLHAGAIGALKVIAPHCLGHECAGRVVWAGSRSGHRIGELVAVEPGVPCGGGTGGNDGRDDFEGHGAGGVCGPCAIGEYNLCPAVKFAGVPNDHGCIRRYASHPGRWLHTLPEGMTAEEGALLEPLSVVLHAFERCHVRLGEGVLIAGAGPIGLVAAAAARTSGCWPIVVTDVDQGRLDFAKSFAKGCQTVQVGKGKSPEDVAAEVRRCFGTVGAPAPRVSFECVGIADSVSTCLHATRRGGEVMVIGVGKSVMDGLPFMQASMAEIDLKFINRYHHSWPYAIRLVRSGYIDLKPMVTHHYKLEEAVQAMETASDRTKNSIKVHITDGELEL